MYAAPTLPRETFVEAQARHRRAGRAATASCLAAVVVVGLPLAVVISPLVVALAVVAADLLNTSFPVPDLGGLAAHHVLGLAGSSPADGLPEILRLPVALAAGATLLVPGIGVLVATWLGVRRLLQRAGPDALVVAVGARPPSADPAEQRLVHLVAEVAIAAGLPAPRVLVVDDRVANAAVVGHSAADATIVVPRGLLDELGRDATGAVVADLLALGAGGDLRVALDVAAVLQTFDLIGAVLAAPTSLRTRRALSRFARLALHPPHPGSAEAAEEARFVAGELAAIGRGAAAVEPARGFLVGLVQLPFLVASLAFTLMRLGPGAMVVDPALAAMWRSRRLAADATAVEFTRDPGALARALAHLEARGATVPAGPWAHLFLVPPGRPESGATSPPAAGGPLAGIIGEGDGDGDRPGAGSGWPDDGRMYHDGGYGREWMRTPGPLGRMRAAAAGWAGRVAAGRWAGAPGIAQGTAQAELVAFVPTLDERLDRLGALGAGPDLAAMGRRPSAGSPGPGAARRTARRAGSAAAWLGRVAGAAAVLAVACALVYVTLVIDALVLAPPTALLHAVLR